VELARGRTEYWAGHFGVAARILTQFLDTITDQPIPLHSQTYGIAPVVAAYGQGCQALWFIGRPDQARTWARNCLVSAEESREPFALAHASFLELLCGNQNGAADFADRAVRVSSDHGVAMFVPMTRFFAGAARAAQGRLEEGLAAMLPRSSSTARWRECSSTISCSDCSVPPTPAQRDGRKASRGWRRGSS
jgi:hypothetical protein